MGAGLRRPYATLVANVEVIVITSAWCSYFPGYQDDVSKKEQSKLLCMINILSVKLKEGISNKAPLQHPQQNIKTPQVRTQIQHTQPGTQRLQGTSNTTYNTKHKRLHINQRDQWATGADFGRPSATQAADGVVIRITCAHPYPFPIT